MKLSLHTISFLLLAAVLTCTAADDLATLKATLQKLCAVNKKGEFGSCCAANNNGQNMAAISSLPYCFGVAGATAGDINTLFVSDTTLPRE